ncbi:MAG: Rab family GTPase [Candidatus Helarchaeota archaeon]
MSETEPDVVLKLSLVGDFAVGKTSFINRVLDDTFVSNYNPTIGATISDRMIRFKDKLIKLLLWDSTGQVAFRTLTKNFLKDTDLAILLYDVTRRDTFESSQYWHDAITDEIQAKIPCILVGNKIDLENERKVSSEEGKALAEKLDIPWMEISVKDNINLIKTLIVLFSEYEKMQ